MNFISWYGILFFGFLVLGVVFCLGSLFGSHGDADGDVDGDLDADADADGDAAGEADAPGALAWVLYAIGSGSVPTGFAVALSCLLFGASGLLCLTLLPPNLPPWAQAATSLGAAALVVLLLARRLCGLIGRYFPTYETHQVTPETFVGLSGTATSDVDGESPGYVGVYDDRDSYHVLTARPIEGPLRKGQKIQVASYDPQTRTYGVLADIDP